METPRPVPKHIRVRQELLQLLNSGAFSPHERLPSEHELSERFGVSRQTLRQALGELEREGLVYRVQGKGTFVSPAPGMRGGVPPAIGVVTTYISDYIFPHIVRGIEQTLRKGGARLVLSSTDNDKKKERDALEAMLKEPLDGLILEPTKSAQGNPNFDCFLHLENRSIPYVMINETYPELSAPCFKVDDERGARLAASHLIAMGHTEIAGFFKTDDFQGVSRLRGFLLAMREAGLPVPPERVFRYETENKHEAPARHLEALLAGKEGRRPTAIVCYNDELAVSLLETIRRAGLRVPDDVSIVGFDDSPLATATETKLTTVTHPKEELGAAAAAALLDMIRQTSGADASQRARGIVFEPVLIERNSVKPIKRKEE